MTADLKRISCLLLMASGCATKPARFETSDAPPPEPPEVSALGELQAPVQTLAEPKYRLEVTTNRFLLALQNRAPQQLESLLLPSATVREETSASGNPALPVLLDLAGAWSAHREPAPGSQEPSVQAFGPTRIVDLQTLGSEAWVTVEVDGPPKVQGLWKIRLGEGRETPQVAEVILPKAN